MRLLQISWLVLRSLFFFHFRFGCLGTRLPLCAVDPGYRDVLQDHDHNERQTSRVVVKHGNKVVSWTLHEQQPQKKGDDAANHWETNGTFSAKTLSLIFTRHIKSKKNDSSPHRSSFRILKASRMGVVMPVMVPIMLPRPKLISMKKNMTDQKGLAGKWVMASVKAMNARPVPWTAWGGRQSRGKRCTSRTRLQASWWWSHSQWCLSPQTLLSSSSSTHASRPSWAKLSSFTVLMTPYISA